MAISRSQMQRQLYEGGGITSLKEAKDVLESQALPGEFLAYINPQEAAMLKYMGGAGIPINSSGVPSFFIKKIAKGVTKAVKGATKAVKDIVSSDVGKLALLAAGGYYLGGGAIGPFQRAGMSGFSLGNLPGATMLKNVAAGAGFNVPASTELMPTAFKFGKALTSGKTALGLAAASILPSLFGGPEEAKFAFARDPQGVKNYLVQYYKNLNKDATDEEAAQFAEEQTREYVANGGRIGFEEGGILSLEEAKKRDPAMFMDTTTYNPIPENAPNMAADEIAKVIMGTLGSDEDMGPRTYIFEEYVIPKRKELMENFGLSLEEADDLIREGMSKIRDKKADGGMPMGIMRTNQAGVMERDYREEGGFVPVGIKEKADDVPAMLSKNEFVFTADAVRGAGNGDVEKGAERLYNTMKTLENGGTV